MNYKLKILSSILLTLNIFVASTNDFSTKSLKERFKNSEAANFIPIAVIGGGSAGLASAIYGGRANMHTVVFMGHLPGGQLSETAVVENIPGVDRKSGDEIMHRTIEQAKEFGALLLEESIKKIEIEKSENGRDSFVLTTENGEKVYALSVILATGASPRKLNVPGEDEYFGNGVSTCALCDCVLYKGLDVVIVGGGDDAVDKAMQLAPYAKKITILVRSGKMRAAQSLQERLHDYANVEIVYNKKVVEIVGENFSVTGVKIIDVLTEQEGFIPVSGVFLAAGQNPNCQLYKDIIEATDDGYIVFQGRSQQTSIEGIYAAGDVGDNQYRQAGTANGDGIKAALDAVKYLRNNGFTEKVAQEMRSKYYRGKKQ